MKYLSTFIIGFLCILLYSCNNKKNEPYTETMRSGVITVAMDESFQPVLQQEIDVFEGINPQASVIPIYVNETEALNLFLQDSVRLAVTTRALSEVEIASFNQRKLFPKAMVIATDGIALIINKENTDSLITVNQLRSILTGETLTWQQLNGGSGSDSIQVVFDHPNSSSVRYALDSICKGAPLSFDLFAQKNNPSVIDFVANHKNSLGIIGVSWIGNKSDTTLMSFVDNIRVMSVSNAMNATSQNSYKPYQAYIATKEYPLIRNIYALLNDPRGALPSGFFNFLTSDRGQRIILKAGIVPATQPIRIVSARDEL